MRTPLQGENEMETMPLHGCVRLSRDKGSFVPHTKTKRLFFSPQEKEEWSRSWHCCAGPFGCLECCLILISKRRFPMERACQTRAKWTPYGKLLDISTFWAAANEIRLGRTSTKQDGWAQKHSQSWQEPFLIPLYIYSFLVHIWLERKRGEEAWIFQSTQNSADSHHKSKWNRPNFLSGCVNIQQTVIFLVSKQLMKFSFQKGKCTVCKENTMVFFLSHTVVEKENKCKVQMFFYPTKSDQWQSHHSKTLCFKPWHGENIFLRPTFCQHLDILWRGGFVRLNCQL